MRYKPQSNARSDKGNLMNNKTDWNPDLYLKFEDERTQPSYDLTARINIPNPASIIDMGCGPGNSTRVLRECWPHAQIVGLDSSPEMIEKARNAYPQGNWILADAATWKADSQYSIIFSNAMLHWLPDQESVIKRLFAGVQSQGALAVQVPANNDSPLHKAVLSVSKREAWKDMMTGSDKVITYHDASFYYDRLAALSGRIFIWHTTYYHVLGDHQGLIDWYASTGMKPYLERLGSVELRQLFQSQVLEECRSAYPEQQNGRILFPFRRLFFIAYKE
jgi:trans-aconitate 2-methyltransferase